MTTPARQYDVLGIGVVAVDDRLDVDAYPPAEHKVQVLRRRRLCGGQTGAALIAAARLGAHAAYGGSLGTDDELSLEARRLLESEGVDLTPCVARSDARPYHSTIIVGRRPPTRTIFAHVEGHVGADPDRPSPEVIGSAAVLLVDHHSPSGTLRAVQIARSLGVAVVADFERRAGQGFDELLTLVDHLVLPERFARELAGADSAAEAVTKLGTGDRKAVVVTCGANGCWFCDAKTCHRPQHLSAPAVEAVDTTGCGDVFHGAYAAALAQGQDLDGCVRLATAAAALKASREEGFSSLAMVEHFLDEWQTVVE